ncbi:hypothetical protein DFJ77DRAFT_444919 [Powellomyces hirtus]|nr:hypothetical protein DFJ77DRAFT_444919 [Powellomyces hirtus]
MYSRSQRKFMAPDADHANPRLGPGCYTQDEPALISGKLFGDEGYAPFSSLTPRHSYFDDTITRGPAPGAYPIEHLRPALHNPHKAPEFGMSKVPRFGRSHNHNPGPGTYRNADFTTKIKSPRHKKETEFKLELSSRTHPLTRQPVQGKEEEEGGGKEVPKEKEREVVRRKSDPARPTVHGHVIPGGKAKSERTYSAGGGGKSKIVWRRKHGAPSIPPTRMAFGFQENADGDLVPRKPPKITPDTAPAYNALTSFAEASKRDHRGVSFSHPSEYADQDGRLHFTTLDTPAPGVYETYSVQNYYATKSMTGNEAAIMTLSPCVRLTDEILNVEKKKNVPGPGAYNIKAPIQENLLRPRNRILFSSVGGHIHPSEYNATEQIRTPGPGAYHPEMAEANAKPAPARSQPFGSTTTRFADLGKSGGMPAPGSYELDEIDSLANRILKKSSRPTPGGFGSISERFTPQKRNLDPGPGTYDPDSHSPLTTHSNTNTPSTPQPPPPPPRHIYTSSTKPPRPPTRITKLTGQGPAVFAVGNLLMNPAKAHMPVFGTQTERFAGSERGDLPPPGSYEIAAAYESLKVAYRVPKTAGMVSTTPREVFSVKERLPGPGQYEPLILEKRDVRRGDGGRFMTTEQRFKPPSNAVPGPGAYLSPDHNSGLLKKTYNITLTEWSRQQLAAASAAAHAAAAAPTVVRTAPAATTTTTASVPVA